ncbi:uncharacterized protein [Apostichopus japonicus]|uniref:uncharacterized protein isoform X4 n=1 Tax=Stichopus japonicus TaxID=307972 RepID=UPI003AB7CC82
MSAKSLKRPASKGRRPFRHDVTRLEINKIQQEIDELKRQTQLGVKERKEQLREDEAETVKNIAGAKVQNVELPDDFGKLVMPYVRSREPNFQEEYLTKPRPFEVVVQEGVPAYNPIDKGIVAPQLPRTKKLPFSKDLSISVDDMKMPKVQSMGVVPIRSTTDITDLNVMMQGKPVLAAEEEEIAAIQEANEDFVTMSPTFTTATSAIDAELKDLMDLATPSNESIFPLKSARPAIKKPAILGSEGTLAPVRFSERPLGTLQAQKEVVIKSARKKVKSAKSSKKSRMPDSLKKSRTSLHSEDVFGSDNESYTSEDTVDLPISRSATPSGNRPSSRSKVDRSGSASSAGSKKSVQELLAEAQDISSPDSVPLHKRKLDRKESQIKKGKKSGVKMKQATEEDESEPKERSVDDIIASLKATKQGKISAKSEADLKIQEIMNRVMKRGADVLGTDVEDEGDQKDEEKEGITFEEEIEMDDTPAISITDEGDYSDIAITLSRPTTEIESQQLETITEQETHDGDSTARGTEMLLDAPVDTERASSVPLPIEGALPPHSQSVLDAVKMLNTIQPEEIDLEQAWRDLTMPQDVYYEDIVKVEGASEPLVEKLQSKETAVEQKKSLNLPVQSSSVSFLSTWTPSDKPEREKTTSGQPELRKSIHHFCTMMPASIALPGQLKMATRMHHTPSRYKVTSHLSGSDRSQQVDGDGVTRPGSSEGKRQRVMSAAAKRILSELEEQEPNKSAETRLQVWQEKAEQMFDEGLGLPGHQLPIHQDASRLYWTPAPPKMNLPASVIGENLFPRFQGALLKPGGESSLTVAGDDSDDDVEVDLALNEEEERDAQFRKRLIVRRNVSAEDLTELTKTDFKGDRRIWLDSSASERGPDTPPIAPSLTSDTLHTTEAGDEDNEKRSQTRSSFTIVRPKLQRSNSAPDITGEEHILFVESDFDSMMQELLQQKEQIVKMKQDMLEDKNRQTPDESENELMDPSKEDIESISVADVKPMRQVHTPTLAERSRAAGLKYVLYPKMKKKKKKKPLDPKRLEDIEFFLKIPARSLERRHSFEEKRLPLEEEFKMPRSVRFPRRPSLPRALKFDDFIAKHRDREDTSDTREWVRGIWDEWFEEVFAESPYISDGEEADGENHRAQGSPAPVPDEKRHSIASSVVSVNIDTLEPLLANDEDRMVFEDLHDEVLRLTDELNKATRPLPFDIARRGALYRKMGKISNAWDDLNLAIELEPQMLDAYWHRHLLYLLKDKPLKALEDLNIILRINKDHVGAYKSRAEIFKQQGDITMAIVNYTQTIKLTPDDYEAYYKRAEMYEKKDEMLLALEDYKEASRLMPSRTEAIFKRGLYQFNNNKNWMAAIKDFTEMLLQEPKNAMARTYRGRAFAKQGMYVEAVGDLSAAIHLDPRNSVAFYHRGCLLRKASPKQALQDLSVSIVLDDSLDNLMAFFHRGILYVEMGKHRDAISDFENVLKLNKHMSAAYVNMGLIYMNKLDNYYKAIQKFTSAIKVDPTYDRALVCRGEAYNKIHKSRHALKDFTSAIHLRPDQQHYYMYRGRVLLKMKNLELASFCVKHASGLSHGLGSSPTQQAAVQSFLQNYKKAIDVLTNSVKVQPNAPSYILLGKTQIKAKKYREAVESLENALEFMKPWNDRQSWPAEAAEVYYLIGMCHTEIPNHLKAFEAFNCAIRINNEYPEAYYQRGLTRMKLRQNKGILDFNRALSLNPELFQAYLSRAAYYGMKKRYSKGIFNCNEAVRLQPNSVRAYLYRYLLLIQINHNKAVGLQPKSVRAYLYRGALKYYIQAYQLAIMDLSKAIDLDTACSLAYFNRAVCFHTTGDFDRAQRDYGIVLMLGEENALKVLINRGLMYLAQKDYKNAREDFLQAVKVNPRDPKIRHTLAICCHKLNRLEEAVKIYTEALQVNPYFLEAYLGRASALMDYGHMVTITLARRDCERALHLNPQSLEARVALGYNLQVCGKFKQAWNHFTAALIANPNFQPALEGRAIVCLQMSDPAAALKDLNAALRIIPTAELHTNRGVVEQFVGDSTDAMNDYQNAIKIDPTYSLAYFNAANLYFQNRQFIQANHYYNKTLEFNPNDEAAVLNRAITRVLLRDARGALEDFQHAASLSPYSAHIFFNRANLFASLRQYELAERDYTTALKLLPDDPMVHKRRADVRSKLGRKRDAIDDYRRAVDIQSKVLVY